MGEGGPRGTGTGWTDLSLSDPTPCPVTSVEHCTPMLDLGAGGNKSIVPQPYELCNDALSQRRGGSQENKAQGELGSGFICIVSPQAPAALFSAPRHSRQMLLAVKVTLITSSSVIA